MFIFIVQCLLLILTILGGWNLLNLIARVYHKDVERYSIYHFLMILVGLLSFYINSKL